MEESRARSQGLHAGRARSRPSCDRSAGRGVPERRQGGARATKDKKVDAALAAFEPLFFNGLVLELDRYFVHRVRPVTGKDGNPLNEVEMLGDSLMNNDGVLQKSTVLKLIPAESVTKLEFGDAIELGEQQFEQLAAAFFAELERKFVAPS